MLKLMNVESLLDYRCANVLMSANQNLFDSGKYIEKNQCRSK